MKYFLAVLFTTLLILLAASVVKAQTMSNGFYIIRMGNLNMSSGHPTGSGYALGFTAGQTANGFYSLTGVNYRVRGGFQYIMSIIPFSFKITGLNIDFGPVFATNAVTRTSTLTVSNGSAGGYIVTASENHPLRLNAKGIDIPDTTCDSGTCTTTTARAWTLPGTFGFGYNCTNVSGTDCSTDFVNSTYFRPFAASPSAVTVMSSSNVGRNRQATITYKLNVSAVQAAGLYTNVINFIATPTY